jgi:hypothetical protein
MSVFIGAVKGSSAIQRKVAEVNKLIQQAKGLYVLDPTSTWESAYRFKPYKYSRGVLFESYDINSGRGWEKRSERWGSFDADMVLSHTKKMLKRAIRKGEEF